MGSSGSKNTIVYNNGTQFVKKQLKFMSKNDSSIDTLIISNPSHLTTLYYGIRGVKLAIPDSVTTVLFDESCEVIEMIDSDFLYSATNVMKIDFSRLVRVKHIGSNFLYRCLKLETVDLSSMKRLRRIDGSFLAGCSGLTTLKLPHHPLASVNAIPIDFLKSCTQLKRVDLSCFSGAQAINNSFLEGCSALQTVDFTPLAQVKEIGECFLWECCGLTALNLDAFANVETINCRFLGYCTQLKTIDLMGLRNVVKIGNGFLYHCDALQVADFTPLVNLQRIGTHTMYHCSALREVQVSRTRNKTIAEMAHQLVLEQQGPVGETKHYARVSWVTWSWSWRQHYLASFATRTAVCAMFCGVTYQHPLNGEVRYLPSEVAYEICTYMDD